MDELRAINTFVKAADPGSFHRAAIAQGTTPQAVSKTVRQLEKHLGVRLFHRTTRKTNLTEDGRRFLETAKPDLDGMLLALSRARRAAKDHEGRVRVSACGLIGRRILMPLLAEFHRLYPRIEVELLLEERYTDIVADRIDVGFRAGGAPEGRVVARRLFPLQAIACAAPRPRAGTPARHGPGGQHSSAMRRDTPVQT